MKNLTTSLSFVGDVEHLGEVLTQAVRGGGLNSTTVGGNEGFDGGGVETSSKLFFLGLSTLDHGNSQQLFINTSIIIKDFNDFLLGFFLGSESTVTFLQVNHSIQSFNHSILAIRIHEYE